MRLFLQWNLQRLNAPAIMNMIPPIIAAVALLPGLLSMKWVHFIPIVETNTAMMERRLLSISTARVAWTSAGEAEVGMLVREWSCHSYMVNELLHMLLLSAVECRLMQMHSFSVYSSKWLTTTKRFFSQLSIIKGCTQNLEAEFKTHPCIGRPGRCHNIWWGYTTKTHF